MAEEFESLEERVPPFRRLPAGEQVMLALSIAAGEMGARIERMLREREPILSHARYNALRILRGVAPEGLSCSGIASRMLLSPPDVTRLVDPLVDRGLAQREPDPADRRVVNIRLTSAGETLLAELDSTFKPIFDAVSEGLGSGGTEQLLQGCARFIEIARALDHDRPTLNVRR